MDLILVRHAQPSWVVEDRGVNDPELSELGRLQAERLASGWPTDLEPDRLWVSSARRSRATVAPLATRFGIEPEVHEALIEVKLPDRFDGAPAREVGKVLLSARHREPEAWWTGLDGGEAYHDFHARVTQALDGLLATAGVEKLAPEEDDPRWRAPDGLDLTVVLVGHGGTNAALTGHLLAYPPRPWIWETLLTEHTGITHLRLRRLMGAHVFALKSQSDVAHLADKERSH